MGGQNRDLIRRPDAHFPVIRISPYALKEGVQSFEVQFAARHSDGIVVEARRRVSQAVHTPDLVTD
jgi:hypothetical protein